MAIDYQYRINIAKQYLEKLETNFLKPWDELFSKYKNGKLDQLDKLSLLHPSFIQNLNLPQYKTHGDIIKEIQGKRNFNKETGTCQSKLIWGYECTYKQDTLCHGDHLFPFSLGGPSTAGNKLLLCRYHNMVKGTDIHLFPWEDMEDRLIWIECQIIKMHTYISLYI